jgi:hypothetical protein
VTLRDTLRRIKAMWRMYEARYWIVLRIGRGLAVTDNPDHGTIFPMPPGGRAKRGMELLGAFPDSARAWAFARKLFRENPAKYRVLSGVSEPPSSSISKPGTPPVAISR